ncbi:MAG: anaerobic glycerol-3-phosphate dehydrogenase subunit C [Deltaproteobacteria bacterium]|nr:anaerobic glycerol-3-phosphate dehydrogenase subunit C [Deltaproteobacteria bacterium]
MSDNTWDARKIHEQLTRIFRGELLFDEISRLAYASAACIYRIKPLGIACPQDAEDLRRLVAFAAREGIPLIARGGGSGRAGQGIGAGILVDFTRHMNRLVHVDVAANRFRVQPGMFLTRLNRSLSEHGRFFPPDPSSGDCASIGGMIANNSSGPHCPIYGDTRSQVQALEVVLPDGALERFNPVSVDGAEWIRMMEKGGRKAELHMGVRNIAMRSAELLQEKRPETTKNCCGYNLWDAFNGESVDLAKLITGSEGTLALVTEAELTMTPLPRSSLTALIYFDAIEFIGQATEEILKFHPAMLEIIERNILDLARERWPELKPFLPQGIEALLFIEFQGEEPEETASRMKALEHRLAREMRIIKGFRVAQNAAERQLLVRVRKASGPVLNTAKGERKPVAFIEDAAVHPRRLSEYIIGLKEIFTRHGVKAAIYGHAGDGNLHIMPFLNLKDPEDVALMGSIAEQTYDLVLGLRGTISAEHGDGLLRSGYVRRQYGELYEAFVEIKRLFDPLSIFNPGRVVESEPDSLVKQLKYGGFRTVSTGSTLDELEIREEIERCSGCGQCRAYCPVADVVGDELSTARAKASLLREVISGGMDSAQDLVSENMKEVFDRCMTCQQCLVECPSGVDIPALVTRLRAHYIRKKGQPLGSRVLADTALISGMGSLGAPLTNLAARMSPVRIMLEAVIGLDRRMLLPTFSRNSFRKRLKERPNDGSEPVAYFSGCFGNYCNPEGESLAAVEVLEKNGFRVTVPDTHCCGAARMALGAFDDLEDDAEHNVELLKPLAAAGVPILFSDPSCLLAVKHDYPRMLSSPESGDVSRACTDLMLFLLKLFRQGKLDTDFGEVPMRVAYHNPCHLKALGGGTEVRELLTLIPGIQWVEVPDSCCGLAGTFGMKKANFDLSAAIGASLFRAIREVRPHRVITGCGACQLQITHGTGIPAMHPIQLLAWAYQRKAPHTKVVAGLKVKNRMFRARRVNPGVSPIITRKDQETCLRDNH